MYVVSSLRLPASAQEARTLGLNLDLDPEGTIDNQLGSVLQGLGSFADIDLQVVFNQLLSSGTLILIADIQSNGLSSADSAGASLRVGINPSPPACSSESDEVCGHHFASGTVIEIDRTAPVDATIASRISGDRLFAGPGAASATIDFMDLLPIAPFDLDSIGTRVEADITADRFDGVVAGAISEVQVRALIVPLVSELAAADCTGAAPDCCIPDSVGETLANIFDVDGDCTVSADEVETSVTLDAFLTPDVDLLDADGRFAPRTDGVKDSFSLGAAFTAVRIDVQEL
jgi:hypothetical protein